MQNRKGRGNNQLTENKVVWTKDLPEGPRTDGVHCAGLQINKYSPRDILPSSSFVVVDIDSLQLKVRISVVRTSWVNSVLV